MIEAVDTVPVAEYLGRRLHQAGVEHLFGVPGDFNLNLLDGLACVDELRWIGSANELGAGYAADAYARSRGLAALITTYGVGELSALNAVAGSAAEDVAVLHVVGSPPTSTVAAAAPVHHTLADGDFGHFARAYAEVTVHQESLDANRAGEQIDAAIMAALTLGKPVYLSVPQDLASHRIPAAPLCRPLTPASDAVAVEHFEKAAHALLARARRPVLVVGQLAARHGLGAALTRLVVDSAIPVVTQISAKGVIDENVPGHHGDYAGSMLGPGAAALVADADVVVHIGTTVTAELTGFFTHRPPDERSVRISTASATVGSRTFNGILFPDAVAALARSATGLHWPDREATPQAAAAGEAPERAAAAGGAGDALTQATFWQVVQAWLPPRTALVADTGTAYWGALGLRLPPDTRFLGQPIWNSIGWALPAVLGQGLAEPDRRPILVIGDGAAQMTIQELGTIAAAGLKPIILLLNNRGYTIERALQSPHAGYNDVAHWNWRTLVGALTGPGIAYHHASTRTELMDVLAEAGGASDALVFVEAQLDAFDTPPLLHRLVTHAKG